MSDNTEKKNWTNKFKKAGLSIGLAASPLLTGCIDQPNPNIPNTSGGVSTVRDITEYDANKYIREEIDAVLKVAKRLDKSEEVYFIKPDRYVETREGFFGAAYDMSGYSSHKTEGGGGTMYGFGGSSVQTFQKNKNMMDCLDSALTAMRQGDYTEMMLYIGDARDRLPRTKSSELRAEIDTSIVEPLVNLYKVALAMSLAKKEGTLFKSGRDR